MPKVDSFISSAAIGPQYTVVNSTTYGRHLRAKRGTHKPLVVTASMKKAGELLRAANGYAKVISDAFKPFCNDIRDGKRWSRLVSLFRKQLQQGDIDLHALTDRFYFHRRRSLAGVLACSVEVTQPDEPKKPVEVKVTSQSAIKRARHYPDTYEQIIIAVFLDADFRATVRSDTKVLPWSLKKTNDHIATFPRPAGARTLVIAIKCTHQLQGKSCPGIASGISVVQVVT